MAPNLSRRAWQPDKVLASELVLDRHGMATYLPLCLPHTQGPIPITHSECAVLAPTPRSLVHRRAALYGPVTQVLQPMECCSQPHVPLSNPKVICLDGQYFMLAFFASGVSYPLVEQSQHEPVIEVTRTLCISVRVNSQCFVPAFC